MMVPMNPIARATSRGEKLREKIDALTDAAMIHRECSSGRPSIELRTPAEAIRAAKVTLKDLQSRMVAKGLKAEDCGIDLCYVDLSFSMGYRRPYIPGNDAALEKDLIDMPVLMIGLMFYIRDRKAPKPEKQILVGIKPFLATRMIAEVFKGLMEQEHSGLM